MNRLLAWGIPWISGVIQLTYSVNRVKQGCVFRVTYCLTLLNAPRPALQEKVQEKDQDDSDDDKGKVQS